MGKFSTRLLLALAFGGLALAVSLAQTPPPPAKPIGRNVEPGLEQAVKWKWLPAPSQGDAWGERIPGNAVPATVDSAEPTPTPLPATPENQTYTIKSGDRLVHIAKKYNITVVQLKGFNKLTSDLIHIGQVLSIPTIEQAKAIAPFPEPPKPKKKDPKAAPTPGYDQSALILQIFLDRENFSVGSIDGKPSPILGKVSQLYQDSHPDAKDADSLQRKAQALVHEPFTVYTLKPEDFDFIVPPKPQRADAAPAKKDDTGPRGGAPYRALLTTSLLAYHSPWEFIAERFHTDETFLRSINTHITAVPQAGTQFRVPNVPPFAIESALVKPLQPRANPAVPTTALIEDLSLLQISQAGNLVAVMPVSGARPGLRGRGTWTILEAIPRPRLATKQEPAAAATPAPALFGSSPPAPTPTPLPVPEYLPSGPNSPVGVLWIDLAKADSPEPLPYGLTGTSIPDQLKLMDSIGGFRLANWNIARAVRLLPPGTPLAWKQTSTTPAVPLRAEPAALPETPALKDNSPISPPAPTVESALPPAPASPN